MVTKKFYTTLGFLALLFISTFPLVSAQAVEGPPAPTGSVTKTAVTGINDAINFIQQTGKPLFKALLGGTVTGGDLFTKILFFIIVTLIVMAVLGQVNLFAGKEWIQVTIGLIFSIIGIRFMPEGMINALALPSSALVAILVVGVPFFIFGAIVTKSIQNSYVRRAVWTVYAVLLIILWVYNLGQNNAVWLWIYPLFIAGCAVAFLFDGTLQKFLNKAKTQRSIEQFQGVEMHTSTARIKELQGAITKEQDPAEREKIKEEITNLRNALKDLAGTS